MDQPAQVSNSTSVSLPASAQSADAILDELLRTLEALREKNTSSASTTPFTTEPESPLASASATKSESAIFSTPVSTDTPSTQVPADIPPATFTPPREVLLPGELPGWLQNDQSQDDDGDEDAQEEAEVAALQNKLLSLLEKQEAAKQAPLPVPEQRVVDNNQANTSIWYQSPSTTPVPTPQVAAVRRYDSQATTTEQKFMRPQKIKRIAVFGYADAAPETQLYKDAYLVSQHLARQGYVIVDGGGPGVMVAATKGAESVGGETLAVTFYPTDAPGFEGRYVGNVADEEIITHNYIERMFKLMENADAYIIFNGGTGTISEFGTAWVMARLYFGKHKPFILYGSFWREVLSSIERNMMMRGNENDVLRIATTASEVDAALREFDAELVGYEQQTRRQRTE